MNSDNFEVLNNINKINKVHMIYVDSKIINRIIFIYVTILYQKQITNKLVYN